MPASTSRPASHERRRSLALWTGVLAGPLTWLSLLQVNYVMAYVACERQQTWFMHVAVAVAVLIVASAGLGAWRASDGDPLADKRRTAPLSDETHRQRARWMSIAGVVLSAWFILVILAMEIPILILQECQ